MRKIMIATAAAVIFSLGLVIVTPAWGQQRVCGNSVEIRDKLDKKYGEARVGLGLNGDGGLVEVFTSKDGFTWTIIVSYTNGRSCLVANGEGWRNTENPAFGPEA